MTVYTISKEFAFSASHQLDGLEEGHPCGRLPGTNSGAGGVWGTHPPPATGFVIDYGRLATFGEYLDGKLDHRHLNDVTTGNPTAENLAAGLLQVLVNVLAHEASEVLDRLWFARVAVSETPKTWAEAHWSGKSIREARGLHAVD
jgi:6-pyruvoyltetrahydropterin/6-carboxytetrahydropterin synthase